MVEFRVITISRGGDGTGYDLTRRITGLRFSNVRPGGDESCTFAYHRSWFSNLPEVARGALLRVLIGLDVLWQGRIEEADRSGDGEETVVVTAYGLGARLRDSQFREIYIDRNVSGWEPMSVQRRIDLMANFGPEDHSVAPDDTTGEPALHAAVHGPWSTTPGRPICEAWYDAGDGVVLGSLYFAWKRGPNVDNTNTNWTWQAFLSDDDVAATTNLSGNLRAAGPSTGTVSQSGVDKRFAAVQLLFANVANTSDNIEYAIDWTVLAAYGDHGLTKQGTADATNAQGFFASQLIEDIAGRATGISARSIDATTFVIQQASFREPVTHEEAIEEMGRFDAHERTWGTWGPDSVLDSRTDGLFDYTELSTDEQHWSVMRSELDSVDLHTETATLYNEVDVAFDDPAGGPQVVTRTRSVPDLDDAGITRRARLDGGSMTLAAAETLGDAFLAFTSGFSPARGSAVISRPLKHHARGEIPPWYLRADGSNLRIPDVFPAISLTDTSGPDRRTTFPIRRVEIDAGGEAPRVTVELDQTSDLLSALQARLGQAAELVGA